MDSLLEHSCHSHSCMHPMTKRSTLLVLYWYFFQWLIFYLKRTFLRRGIYDMAVPACFLSSLRAVPNSKDCRNECRVSRNWLGVLFFSTNLLAWLPAAPGTTVSRSTTDYCTAPLPPALVHKSTSWLVSVTLKLGTKSTE